MYLEISNPMDYRVAQYIRLSKEDESEGPSQSVTNQQSLLNEFVTQHRLTVYDTYIDDGFSGTTFDRPAFRRMINDIEAGKVNKGNVDVPVVECRAPYKIYLDTVEFRQNIINLIDDKVNNFGQYAGLKFGSMEGSNNEAGNWED